jgi:hypothetical protein
MWIFSLGGEGSNVTDAKKDGITNPAPYAGNKGQKSLFPDDDGGYLRLMGGAYFKNPVPILGKVATQGKKKAEAEPKPKVEARPAPQLADQALKAAWIMRLRTAAAGELKAGREPQFELASMRAKATLRELRDDGTMVLAIAGTGEMTFAWAKFGDRDRAGLADAMARRNEAELQGLAAFFLLLVGDEAAGREHLMRAQGLAAEIEQAFGLTVAAKP